MPFTKLPVLEPYLTMTVRQTTQPLRTIAASALLFLCSLFFPSIGICQPPSLQKHLSESALKKMDSLIQEAIAQAKMPGCVVCVGRSDQIIHLQAYGNKRVEPSAEAMTLDTLFDMASITKPVATGSSIMKLIEQGKLKTTDKVIDHFPNFGNKGKEAITVLDLLVHRSGLIPDNSIKDYENGPEVAWEKICELPLTAPIGEAFKYSDVNFIVLGKLVEKVSGMPLNEFVRKEVYEPIGMLESGYLPSAPLRERAAPTEKRGEQWIQGDVHDPRAFALNGVAGHAGLFSTAADMAKYAQMFLNRGKVQKADGTSVQVFASETLELMAKGVVVPGGLRGLSWDKQTGFSTNKGDRLSAAAVGHGGFTGTVLWIDPAQDLFVIFLSNRVHPNGKGSVNLLAGKLWNVAVDDLRRGAAKVSTAPVNTGLDCLVRDGFRPLAGKRVGLITNHTAITKDGEWIVPIFSNAKEFKLNALFSPEHGFEGKLDIAKVEDAKDKTTGMQVFSLYGETRRPTAKMLEELDVLVFDIQDIGARFYTYVSTMGEAMRASAEFKKKFVVLDRPNPINGVSVEGPMLDNKYESFVGYHHLPVRHGMTVGEIAMMLRAELKIDLDLEIVPCEGWDRERYFDSTDLFWVNPSPNMRSLKQAILYPGIGLLEMTNISVGRGTDTPFEWIGAPWMNGKLLAKALNECGLKGVVFIPTSFTPNSSKHAEKLCHGVLIDVVDRAAFEPVKTGIVIASQLKKLHSEDWDVKNLNRLLGCKQMEADILDGKDWDSLEAVYWEGTREFLQRRATFLLYP